MIILKTNNIKKYYGKEPVLIKALDGIDLNIEEGSFTAIVGSSGSGKSTLLNIIGGLDIPTSGSVSIDNQELNKMDKNELTIFRRRNIGFVFQNYNLISNLNIFDNIVLPIELDGKIVDNSYLNTVIETLKLKDKLYSMPSELSGGQQQRVAIARALITKPAIILADEPTGNLDSKTSLEVIGLLQMTSKTFKQTIIMITHDEKIAQLADNIIHIEDGKIVKRNGC